jgi:hypothetical protein
LTHFHLIFAPKPQLQKRAAKIAAVSDAVDRAVRDCSLNGPRRVEALAALGEQVGGTKGCGRGLGWRNLWEIFVWVDARGEGGHFGANIKTIG